MKHTAHQVTILKDPAPGICAAIAPGLAKPYGPCTLPEGHNWHRGPNGVQWITGGILDEITAERARQDLRWGEQNHPDGTGQYPETIDADVARMACQGAAEGGYLDWLHILREEVAEAFAETDPAALRAELVQVAAVAVAWIEAIDRRATEPRERTK